MWGNLPYRWRAVIRLGRQIVEETGSNELAVEWAVVEAAFTYAKRGICETWQSALCQAVVFKAAWESHMVQRIHLLMEQDENCDVTHDVDEARKEVMRLVRAYHLVSV